MKSTISFSLIVFVINIISSQQPFLVFPQSKNDETNIESNINSRTSIKRSERYLINNKPIPNGKFKSGLASINDQCTFFEDFSNPVGWTQVGSLVEIKNNEVQFIDGAPDGYPNGIQRRLFKKLAKPITESDLWTASFKFTPQSVGDFGGPFTGHLLFSLTNNTQDPWCDCSDLNCTGYPPGSQDVVSITYMSPNPPNGNLSFFITVRSNYFRYDSPPLTYSKLGDEIYVELIKDNLNFILNIFSDKEHTKPLGNGPVNLNIICLPELNYIQHGNLIVGYESRQLTGSLDNVCIQINGKCNTKFTPINYIGCQGDGYSITVNGKTYNENNPTGTDIFKGVNCCDSIIIVNLFFTDTYESNIIYRGCQNDGYSVRINGKIFDQDNPIGTEIVSSDNGCDSIYHINLAFNKKDIIQVKYDGCEGDKYNILVGDELYDESNNKGSKHLINQFGCDSLVIVDLKFKDCVKIYDELCKIDVPNIFSPDNDGLNDNFFINYNELCELKEFHVFIYDRWGNNIFYSDDIKFKWNGKKNDKELNSGVYTYIIRYLPLHGTEKNIAGDITLIK